MGSRAGSGTSSVKLGLVAAPDLPAKIAYELADELPGLLANHIDGRVSWEVPVICDPLTGGEEEAPQILDQTQELMWQEGWDHAISITDLPILRSGRVVVANVRVNPGVAGSRCPPWGRRCCVAGYGRPSYSSSARYAGEPPSPTGTARGGGKKRRPGRMPEKTPGRRTCAAGEHGS